MNGRKSVYIVWMEHGAYIMLQTLAGQEKKAHTISFNHF